MEVIVEVRSGGAVADGLAVVGVDDAVVSEVNILHVARINRGERLYRIAFLLHFGSRDDAVAVDVVALLEESVSHISECLSVTLAGRRGVGKELWSFCLFLHDALVESERCAEAYGEVFVYLLGVVG